MKRVILLMFFVILFTQSQVHALAQTLVTESYKTTVNIQCEDGEVSCDQAGSPFDSRYTALCMLSSHFIDENSHLDMLKLN